MRRLSCLVLVGSVSIVGCSRAERTRQHPASVSSSPSSEVTGFGPRVDEPAPDVLPIVDAASLKQRIRESGQRGVVVNAWASWCDPCREELPMLARVAPKLAAQGVPIWLVSVDDPDGFAAAKALLDTLHISLPAFAAAPPLQDFKLGVNPEWPGMIPVSFLFDASGKLRYFWPGEVYEKELVPIVEGFAAGKHIDGTANFGLAPGATQGAGHE
jgi:thiol-disulfide isomerase/thioredoxin